MQDMRQSWVENEHYSVVYFNRVAMFEARYRTFVNVLNAVSIDAATHCV